MRACTLEDRHMFLCLGQALHDLRSRRKLALHELAHLCSFSNSRLQQCEFGAWDITLEEIFLITNNLGFDIQDFWKAFKVFSLIETSNKLY